MLCYKYNYVIIRGYIIVFYISLLYYASDGLATERCIIVEKIIIQLTSLLDDTVVSCEKSTNLSFVSLTMERSTTLAAGLRGKGMICAF